MHTEGPKFNQVTRNSSSQTLYPHKCPLHNIPRLIFCVSVCHQLSALKQKYLLIRYSQAKDWEIHGNNVLYYSSVTLGPLSCNGQIPWYIHLIRHPLTEENLESTQQWDMYSQSPWFKQQRTITGLPWAWKRWTEMVLLPLHWFEVLTLCRVSPSPLWRELRPISISNDTNFLVTWKRKIEQSFLHQWTQRPIDTNLLVTKKCL